jgi:ribonuclease P protein component
MLPPEHRLRHSSDFKRLRQNGSRWRGQFMALSVLPNTYNRSRFGFVVSSRVGNAVTRNRVKRRLRAIIHEHLAAVQPGIDAVIVAYPQAASAAYTQLQHDLVDLLRRSGHFLTDG